MRARLQGRGRCGSYQVAGRIRLRVVSYQVAGRGRLRVVSGASWQVAGRIVSGCGSHQVAGRIRLRDVSGCGSFRCGTDQVAGRIRWRVGSGGGSYQVAGRSVRLRVGRSRYGSVQDEGKGEVVSDGRRPGRGLCRGGDRRKVKRKPGVSIGLRERAENRAWRERMRFVRME